jgi:hypothetical protein
MLRPTSKKKKKKKMKRNSCGVEPSAPSTGSQDDDAERSGGVSKAKPAQLQSKENFQLSFGNVPSQSNAQIKWRSYDRFHTHLATRSCGESQAATSPSKVIQRNLMNVQDWV